MGLYRLLSVMIWVCCLGGSIVAQTVPSITPMTCRFPMPDTIIIDCYALRVPENRQTTDSKTIQLAIAILRHPSGTPEPDPILFLQGGPGGSTLTSFDLTFNNRFEPLFAANRDIIIFDQRGTGTSNPSLDCNVFQSLQVNLLDHTLNGQVLDNQEINQTLNQALIECGQALATRHDLDVYTTVENAADLEAIRQALGYDQVNLWGISYGTKLALTAMRDYPDSFRRVVLDSVYPLEANLYTDLPTNYARALERLFSRCRADTACNRTFPNLDTILTATVERLNQQPVQFNAPNPYQNESYEVFFDGNELLRTLFRLFYSTELLPRLPQLIYDAYNGDFDVWLVLVGWLTAQGESVATGMNYTVQCQEEFAFTPAGSISEAWALYLPFATYRQTINTFAHLEPICAAFSEMPAAPRENQPVVSDIPTLLLAGEYDPITPPQWANQVADHLSNHILLDIKAHGHGPSGNRGCPQSILIDFISIDDPAQLNTECLNALEMIFSGTERGDFTVPNAAQSTSIVTTAMP